MKPSGVVKKPSRREKGAKRNYKLDVKLVEKYLVAGLNAIEIASICKVAPSTIYRYISTRGKDYDSVEHFRNDRADLLAADQRECLTLQSVIRQYFGSRQPKSMKDSDLISWYKALGLDAAVKFDKERLERSKSMGDIRIFTLIYERADRMLFEERTIEVKPLEVEERPISGILHDDEEALTNKLLTTCSPVGSQGYASE